jgi:hypothetical protein
MNGLGVIQLIDLEGTGLDSIKMDEDRIVEVGDDYITVSCGTSVWMDASGLYWLEKDYRVGGEVWRVHKNDPDPYPSRPHAHCIGVGRGSWGANCTSAHDSSFPASMILSTDSWTRSNLQG